VGHCCAATIWPGKPFASLIASVTGCTICRKSIAESLVTTGYAVPLVLVNPYLAGSLFLDYLFRGRFHLIPSDPQVLAPDDLSALTAPTAGPENPGSAGFQAPGAATDVNSESQTSESANSGLEEIKAIHE
jgi:hypothetical protein